MITILDKKDCCACGACANACPKRCIEFKADEEGFAYPKVNLDKCVDCGLCEKVCPILSVGKRNEPLACYAAKSKDATVVLKSSSGGIFWQLASLVIGQGGAVIGARFKSDWTVRHDIAETLDELECFKTSKYMQSEMPADIMVRAKKILDAGRRVMFTGTQCQIAGFKNFLRKEYANLICADVICHGVPSAKLWTDYLSDLKKRLFGQGESEWKISNVNFRHKSAEGGWNKFCLKIDFACEGKTRSFVEPFCKNIYMMSFLRDICLRESCYACPVKNLNSRSDITLADFWGIDSVVKNFDTNKGTSLILANTKSGEAILMEIGSEITIRNTDFKASIAQNESLVKSVKRPKWRDVFLKKIAESPEDIAKIMSKYSAKRTLYEKSIKLLKRCGLLKIARKMIRGK